MAQWNPYYGAPSNSVFEEQNLESQVFNPSVPYGAIPYQTVNYNNYYVPNVTNYRPNLPSNIRTAQDIEAEQFSQYMNQIPTQHVVQSQYLPDRSTQSPVYSTLTPTAAEFKPSTSYAPIVSQTFSNNNYKNIESDKKIEVKSESEPSTSKINEGESPKPDIFSKPNKQSYKTDNDRYKHDNRMKDSARYRENKDNGRYREDYKKSDAIRSDNSGNFERYKQGERDKDKHERYRQGNQEKDDRYKQNRDNNDRNRQNNDRYRQGDNKYYRNRPDGEQNDRFRQGSTDKDNLDNKSNATTSQDTENKEMSNRYQQNRGKGNDRYNRNIEKENLNKGRYDNRVKSGNTQDRGNRVSNRYQERTSNSNRQSSSEKDINKDRFDRAGSSKSETNIENKRDNRETVYQSTDVDGMNRNSSTEKDNQDSDNASTSKAQDNRDNKYHQNRENRYKENYSGRYRQDNRENKNDRYSQDRDWRDNRDNRSYRNNYNKNYRDQDSYQREYYGSRNNRYSKNNGEGGQNRSYEYERSNSDGYKGSNSKNSYRDNQKEEVKYENWRSNMPSIRKEKIVKEGRKGDYQKPSSSKTGLKPVKNEADISQRERLIEQVNKGTLECLVCYEFVRHVDKVWSCQKCYHVFHLRCCLKWAKTSQDEKGWRCPACQHVYMNLPQSYSCYCGKSMDPVYRPGDTAHSCGNVCGRPGIKPGCPHTCRLLCHPGPCPVCEDLISKSCSCGATKQIVKCSASIPLVCKAICSKTLNCGVHICQKTCHPSECDVCPETIDQECFCGKAKRNIPCSMEHAGVLYYSCEEVCDKLLKCGNHKCTSICHPGDCPPCVRAIDYAKTCPCGKTQLTEERKSCLDPIPCCDEICGKRYTCGPTSTPHTCQSTCHEGDCPVCPLTSQVLCRCGYMSKEIPCSELTSRSDDARCQKKCTKKRSCAKHKCNQFCCIDVDHICPLPCNRTLSCGQHRCEQTCHNGRCMPCWRTSFEELYCECGASVIYPPVMCGTKRPPCTRPCTRTHECEHEPQHNCHSLPECPPCTILTTKWCHGGHEKRKTIPCHQKEFSCGLPCNRDLPCGRHKCIQACHKGPCLREGQSCLQLCTTPRATCGHACGLPCHDPPCPESPCKEMVKVSCECGLRTSTRACIDMTGEYQRIENSILASKMADMQLGHTTDITIGPVRGKVLKTLECNDECRITERNRRMAIGLQIRNPDLSSKLTPRYSDFMRQWAKKDSRFVQMVHDKLTELVQLAKQSKQKSRSHSFDSMNRDKRHLIHEYCEHFGCDSAAYDQEPNRNVVATASRDKAWLPSCSVLELLRRESGQRKVPGPILNRPLGASASTSATVSLKVSTSATPRASYSSSTAQSSQPQRPKTPEGETIDYFDYDVSK